MSRSRFEKKEASPVIERHAEAVEESALAEETEPVSIHRLGESDRGFEFVDIRVDAYPIFIVKEARRATANAMGGSNRSLGQIMPQNSPDAGGKHVVIRAGIDQRPAFSGSIISRILKNDSEERARRFVCGEFVIRKPECHRFISEEEANVWLRNFHDKREFDAFLDRCTIHFPGVLSSGNDFIRAVFVIERKPRPDVSWISCKLTEPANVAHAEQVFTHGTRVRLDKEKCKMPIEFMSSDDSDDNESSYSGRIAA